MAASYGHIEIVELLLSKPNIDINCKNILIRKYGIEINNFNFSALSISALNYYEKIVEHLLSKPNIDINLKGFLF